VPATPSALILAGVDRCQPRSSKKNNLCQQPQAPSAYQEWIEASNKEPRSKPIGTRTLGARERREGRGGVTRDNHHAGGGDGRDAVAASHCGEPAPPRVVARCSSPSSRSRSSHTSSVSSSSHIASASRPNHINSNHRRSHQLQLPPLALTPATTAWDRSRNHPHGEIIRRIKEEAHFWAVSEAERLRCSWIFIGPGPNEQSLMD
jgi:hypothetical protein